MICWRIDRWNASEELASLSLSLVYYKSSRRREKQTMRSTVPEKINVEREREREIERRAS